VRLHAVRAAALLGLLLPMAGCAGRSIAPPMRLAQSGRGVPTSASLPVHAIIGFSVDTPERAAIAAREGITTTILYGGSPGPASALAKALEMHGIGVVDGSISGLLSEWECHRTHTVAPPPASYGKNTYCAVDGYPQMTAAQVVRDAARIAVRDAKRPYVTGYWVLDDWAWWDPGSGRSLLKRVHAAIASATPGLPAICGFGAGIAKPNRVSWDPGTAANFSGAACDVVGWYNYACIECTHPSSGKQLDWSMTALLPAMRKSLAKYGWNIATTPLYGIGQAWSGSYAKRYYTWGLTPAEMAEQARAFCSFGAAYVGWYAWDDSGYDARTQTPANSAAIASGIRAGINACEQTWAT
jgi:hypothetical protein